MRTAEISRKTKETEIVLKLDLDGAGAHEIDTGVGFFNHMLELFAVHANVGLKVRCHGDTDVDFHHSVEDIGICLGQAFKEALGDKRGIARFADRVIPMDELSGKIGEFDAELVEEFMRAFCFNAGVNLYMKLLKRGNAHHEAESLFKAFARCVRDAVAVSGTEIPSSKGVL